MGKQSESFSLFPGTACSSSDARSARWQGWPLAAGLLLGALSWPSQAQVPLRISVQPANYPALPVHVAIEKGFWRDAGITPTLVSYPAGLPQIKANADWDVGISGTVPALIGARDFGLITIAIGDDQSRTNALMARPETIERIKAQRAIPKGTRFAVTMNSTGDYTAQTCLAFWGGNLKSDMVYQGATQPEIIQAGVANTADILALWAPNTYTMQEKHGFKPLCTAKDFGPGVFSAVMTSRKFAEANPDLVAKFLATMMRAVNWIKANPAEAQAFLIRNAKKEGVDVSVSGAKSEYETRPLFNLEDQFKLIGKDESLVNDSPAGRSFYTINVFLNEGKAGSRSMKPATFLDTRYLKRVQSDPALLRLATSP
jgi:ABC-type nitrate/sulfonate/bicarbonate transport system substrate-binding protein